MGQHAGAKRLCGQAHACTWTCVCTWTCACTCGLGPASGLSLSDWVSERRVDSYAGDKVLRASSELKGHLCPPGPAQGAAGATECWAGVCWLGLAGSDVLSGSS